MCTLKVPAIERWKPLKYGALKYRWLKENGIETRQIVGHVAASALILYGAFRTPVSKAE
jgi:hypothetical protein